MTALLRTSGRRRFLLHLEPAPPRIISYSETRALTLITDPGTLKREQELLKPAK